MPKFIKLTNAGVAVDILAAISRISHMHHIGNETYVYFGDKYHTVTETPEEIIAMIDAVESNSPVHLPDWSKAPAWANWWAVDINGSAFWFAKEPEPDLDDEGKEYGVWTGDLSPAEDDYWVQNWRETLCERPEPEQAETPKSDFAKLLFEFMEFKRLLSCELSQYNERLNALERTVITVKSKD